MFFFKLKMILQKIFRKSHASDENLWNLFSHLAKIILPKLQDFKKLDRLGYPIYFEEYNENSWASKEDYDKAIKEGKMIGGGKEKWEEVLDEIIFSLEFIVYDSKYNYKKLKELYDRNNIEYTDDNGYPDLKNFNQTYEKIINGFKLLGNFFLDLWD